MPVIVIGPGRMDASDAGFGVVGIIVWTDPGFLDNVKTGNIILYWFLKKNIIMIGALSGDGEKFSRYPTNRIA